ncbi:MAG TPA: hypothetical protein VKU00_00585 [Chthonomonadaceae bacterium]|nr:hypothetical protein [Chthonomonadaceae bacterium]
MRWDSRHAMDCPAQSRFSRREALAWGGCLLAAPTLSAAGRRPKRVAGITTVYYHNSHADVLLSRLLQGENLDFHSRKPDLDLVSLYVDQFPQNDMSRSFAQQYGFRLSATIEEALTLGGDRLAVDGVLIIGEHGNYPQNEKGEDLYPRKRFFDAALEVLRQSRRSVPIFVDKHLSHSWQEAREMADEAHRMHIPLMAGSSLPSTWRRPALEVSSGARLKEAVAISYHTLYGYGFHALEMLQCLAERRQGGETGVRRVQCLEGAAVWEAGRQGRYDRALLEAALARIPGVALHGLETAVPNPVVFLIEYRDGFRASVFTLNPSVGAWSIAWRSAESREPQATLFWTQEARPLGHFTFLLHGIEEMIHTGRSTRPLERTLLTSGMMDFLLTSRLQRGAVVETPELAIRYHSQSDWKDPGPPPPGRPLDQQ